MLPPLKKILLFRIEIPSETVTVDILRENVALENGALQGHSFPRIHCHAYAEGAHRIARTAFGNVGVEKSGPSKREKRAVVGNDELAVGDARSGPYGKTRRPVVFTLKEILLEPKLAAAGY
jgi:hypothetical protein